MKKILIFLFTMSFLFFICFIDKVYAKEVIPYFSSINDEVFSTISKVQNVSVSSSISSDTTYDLNIKAVSFGDMNFTNYPYILLYFYSNNANLDTTSVFSIKQTSTCNQSCFNYYNLSIVNLGIGQYNNTTNYRYVIILPVQKIYENPSQSDDPVSEVTGNIRLSTTASYVYFRFTNFILADSSSIENNSYKDFNSIISSATTNTQNIINSQNSNTQNIINNQNSNTQDIINNQNQNQQQAHQDSQNTQNAINDVNNTLNDETGVPNNDVSSTASEWSNKLAGTGPVSSLVLMPITFLNAFTTGFNTSCSPYSLGSFYGTELVLPCIDISNYLGSSLWNVIDIIISGLLAYHIGKKFVKVFNDFTNLRDNQVDELYGGGK